MELTLKEIADSVEGTVIGDDRIIITGINSLEEASQRDISFYSDSRYRGSLQKTKASAILVSEMTDLYHGPQVVVSDPSLAYAKVAGLFAPPVPRFSGISNGAHIHESSKIGDNVSIHPFVYVGEEADIGDGVTLFSGTFIGDRVTIGERTIIYPNVTIMNDCIIGNEVIINAGCVIGSDGFRFVREGTINVKIPQLGIVQIDDHVELGASNCVDRASFGKTWIKRGVKTDNQVHIGHNVIIGEDTVVVAQVGISGSVHIGREVMIGGQVGFSDHLEIGDRVMIVGGSGVIQSIPPDQVIAGFPTMPHRLWLKISSLKRRLPEFHDRLRVLEKKLNELEKRLG